MTDDEIELLRRELSSAKTYFEFGAGESTKLAVRESGIEKIMSTESDREFIRDRLMLDDVIVRNVDSGRLHFADIDIGPTGRWGRPQDKGSRQKWPRYPDAIRTTDTAWDLVLVDGVFRVACVAAAMLHNPDARVLVHDFWRRKRYRPVLDISEEIETANQLVLLRRSAQADDETLMRLLRRHALMPTDQTVWLRLQSKFGVKI